MWKGVIWALLAGLMTSLVFVCVKLGGEGINIPTILFFRQVVPLLLILPATGLWVYRSGPQVLKTHQTWRLTKRAILTVGANYAVFFAITLIPFVDAVVLRNTQPLFIPIFAFFYNRTRIGWQICIGLAIGFLGVICILKPGLGIFGWGSLLALLAGILNAFTFRVLHRLSKSEPQPRLLFYHFLISCILASIPLAWNWETPQGIIWLYVIGAGLFAALYQFFLLKAFSLTRPTIVSALLYSTLVFAVLWETFLFDHFPSWLTLTGVVLVCVGAIVTIVFRNTTTSTGKTS